MVRVEPDVETESSHLGLCVDAVGLTDLLTQFYQFHLRGHVSHGPHALSQVLIADEAVFVFVKLPESLPQLCRHSRTLVKHKDHRRSTQTQQQTVVQKRRRANRLKMDATAQAEVEVV